MATPLYTCVKDAKVGIYDNCAYVARIYRDKIIVRSPYIKWVGNSGGLDYRREVIRNQKVIDRALADMADGCEDSALAVIGQYLLDDYLACSDF